MTNTINLHKQFTEPIFTQLADYRAELVKHPLFDAAHRGKLPISILRELAFHQYSDSILWIPMLAQMKSKAEKSRRLRQAIEDNIGHEAGLGGESHVTLAVQLMRSLGIESLDPYPSGETLSQSASLWLSTDFAVSFTEPMIAGFLLTAETLVPIMFESVISGFERIPGCDTRYFKEHIHIDSDEHARWMAEAVDDVVNIYGPSSVTDVMSGMADAWVETIDIPDLLWSRAAREEWRNQECV